MSKIQWTNETLNPIIGCNKISEGCKNCYAEKMAFRLAHMEWNNINADNYICSYGNVVAPNVPKWTGQTHFQESQLEKPFKWKKPRMIFVCSMGDLFHESVDFVWIDKVFNIIRDNPQHTFQILTKRPERMQEWFKIRINTYNNVWLGVTTENQEQANKRIPILLQIPARIHFISVEPMLSEVDLECFPETGCPSNFIHDLDWVICGGESGHNARPIKAEWVRSLKDQCESANVPFFFKQWNKKEEGSLLDSKEYKQFPKK